MSHACSYWRKCTVGHKNKTKEWEAEALHSNTDSREAGVARVG